MATGATTRYFLPYPLSTDPVRVAGDIEQLANKIDVVLEEEIQDTSAAMWTGGTFTNGLSVPTYNDTTGKMSMSLAQDIQTTATPTFSGANLIGGDLYIGQSRTLIFEGSSNDSFKTTLTVDNPTENRTITFQNITGTVALTSESTLESLVNISNGTGEINLQLGYGATTSGTIKTINIGGNGTSGSTTNINIGSAVSGALGTTTINSATASFLGDITIAMGKSFKINGTSVLDATSLGSSIVSSSLTSVGTITTGTWSATAIAANKGGTGQTSYTIGDLLYASSTSELSKLSSIATGNALISGGVGEAPSWGKIELATHVSGTLAVANGGTGSSSAPTAGSIVYGNGTSFAFTSAGSSGQVLTSNGTDPPTWAALPGASTITISGDASGSGTDSITLTLANSGVTAATYGSSNSIPVIEVDSKGRITSASNQTIDIDPMPQILMMAGM
jgi:hypothetical protein